MAVVIAKGDTFLEPGKSKFRMPEIWFLVEDPLPGLGTAVFLLCPQWCLSHGPGLGWLLGAPLAGTCSGQAGDGVWSPSSMPQFPLLSFYSFSSFLELFFSAETEAPRAWRILEQRSARPGPAAGC